MSADKWTDKEIVAYIYKGILFRYNKEWDPVTLNSMGGPCRHMSGGLSQTNKDKCPMISLICGIEKQKKNYPHPTSWQIRRTDWWLQRQEVGAEDMGEGSQKAKREIFDCRTVWSPVSSQGKAPPHPPDCKPHKRPVLINHFLSSNERDKGK